MRRKLAWRALRRELARASGPPAVGEPATVEAIRVGDPQHNAAELRKLLQCERGAYRDEVLFNAAGALMVADEVESWTEGAEEAAEAIDKGLANALIDCWIATTK